MHKTSTGGPVVPANQVKRTARSVSKLPAWSLIGNRGVVGFSLVDINYYYVTSTN